MHATGNRHEQPARPTPGSIAHEPAPFFSPIRVALVVVCPCMLPAVPKGILPSAAAPFSFLQTHTADESRTVDMMSGTRPPVMSPASASHSAASGTSASGNASSATTAPRPS